jgi:hypothetical protein
VSTVQVDPTASPASPLPATLAVGTARERVDLRTWGPLEQVQGLTLRGNRTLEGRDVRMLALQRTIAVEADSGQAAVPNGGGTAARRPDGWAELWLLPWLGHIGPRTI